ncbi:uncharacterized protein LOC132637457 [Lycium barbarum]|uniref:uncharacterized protein LOC132637457 n=1 Tax=Lycium barbarum TaxID=112863 RepID=UPI00293E6796|nr:uncharacterized protein LOC132637457 [Lycium barbarum]
MDKVNLIQEKLLVAQSRQKMFADRKIWDLEFIEGVRVVLKISSMKGVVRFGKRSKLSPRCSSGFSLYMLKKYYFDGSYIVCWDSVLLDMNLSYEEDPITILDRQVRKLRSKEIASIKVQWKHLHIKETTWETESDMRKR